VVIRRITGSIVKDNTVIAAALVYTATCVVRCVSDYCAIMQSNICGSSTVVGDIISSYYAIVGF
jgi:hypothetical protein